MYEIDIRCYTFYETDRKITYHQNVWGYPTVMIVEIFHCFKPRCSGTSMLFLFFHMFLKLYPWKECYQKTKNGHLEKEVVKICIMNLNPTTLKF